MVYLPTVSWFIILLVMTEPNRTRPTTTPTTTITTTEATTTTEVTTTEKPIDPFLAPKKAIIEETFPATIVFLAGGGGLIFVTIFCLILICCRRGGAPETRSSHPRGKKRRPRKETRSITSSVSDSAPRAKKIEAEKINMMEFADKGALVMQDVKGEVKHALENVKSKEIVRVQYDTGQNEIVTIGSEVEIIKSSAAATGTPDDPKSSKKTPSQKSKVV
ncbi:hypothetical protein Aduo_006806 [Ancylostoma duodenale]